MAASIEFKRGGTVVVSAVHEGTKQDGTPWQQVHFKDETGKVEAGGFMVKPIPNLREGDCLVLDDVASITKRTPNRYAYNTKTQPFTKLEKPSMWITENTLQLQAHLAGGGGFSGGGFNGGGFQATELTPEEESAELPF